MASLVGNFFIGIIVYKTQALRKPINYFIVSMAMSDLFYPLFVCPRRLTQLYADSWVISGPFGRPNNCLLSNGLPYCVDPELDPHSCRPICSCGISPPFSNHQFKAVPFVHSRHLDHRDGCPLATFIRLESC